MNIGPKLAWQISASNTHFESYVKYDGPTFERKELCDEKYFLSLKSNKSLGLDYISSNVIKSV